MSWVWRYSLASAHSSIHFSSCFVFAPTAANLTSVITTLSIPLRQLRCIGIRVSQGELGGVSLTLSESACSKLGCDMASFCAPRLTQVTRVPPSSSYDRAVYKDNRARAKPLIELYP